MAPFLAPKAYAGENGFLYAHDADNQGELTHVLSTSSGPVYADVATQATLSPEQIPAAPAATPVNVQPLSPSAVPASSPLTGALDPLHDLFGILGTSAQAAQAVQTGATSPQMQTQRGPIVITPSNSSSLKTGIGIAVLVVAVYFLYKKRR